MADQQNIEVPRRPGSVSPFTLTVSLETVPPPRTGTTICDGYGCPGPAFGTKLGAGTAIDPVLQNEFVVGPGVVAVSTTWSMLPLLPVNAAVPSAYSAVMV